MPQNGMVLTTGSTVRDPDPMPYLVSEGPRDPAAIKAIFADVTRRQGRKYAEVFAERFGQTKRACRNWPYRGIPQVYWPEVSALSGRSLADIEAAHVMAVVG